MGQDLEECNGSCRKRPQEIAFNSLDKPANKSLHVLNRKAWKCPLSPRINWKKLEGRPSQD